MSKTTVRLVAATFAALVGATTLAACGEDEATRDETTNEVTEAGQADASSLEVGDCLQTPGNEEDDEFSEAEVVPCDEPHDEEIFFAFDLEDGEFPGDDAIQDEALTQCDAEFEAFAGVAYDDSELDWYPFTPTQSSWDDFDDRVVQCVIYDPAGPVEGSLEGAGR